MIKLTIEEAREIRRIKKINKNARNVFISKNEARFLQLILDLGEGAIEKGLVSSGEEVFKHIEEFDNGIYVCIELWISDTNFEDKAYFTANLYDSKDNILDTCDYEKIVEEFILFDNENNDYRVSIEIK